MKVINYFEALNNLCEKCIDQNTDASFARFEFVQRKMQQVNKQVNKKYWEKFKLKVNNDPDDAA